MRIKKKNLALIKTLWTEKAMAPHSSTLAWKIPWTEKPGRLRSMGSLRVRRDWAASLSLSTFMYWRRKWQPTPVFLPGESQGWGSLVGCLSSLGSHRVRHNWSDLAAAAARHCGTYIRVYMHLPIHGPQSCHGEGAHITQWSYEPCHAGPPKTDGS